MLTFQRLAQIGLTWRSSRICSGNRWRPSIMLWILSSFGRRSWASCMAIMTIAMTWLVYAWLLVSITVNTANYFCRCYADFRSSIQVNSTVSHSCNGTSDSVCNSYTQSFPLDKSACGQSVVVPGKAIFQRFQCVSSLSRLRNKEACIIPENRCLSVQKLTGQFNRDRKLSHLFHQLLCLLRTLVAIDKMIYSQGTMERSSATNEY